jgi:hypothetical protein
MKPLVFRLTAVLMGLAVFVFGMTSPALAATCTWTGTVSSDWNVAGNWSGCGSGIPGGSDTAIIGSATNNPIIVADTTVGTLTIQNGGLLTYRGGTGVTFSITTFNIEDGGKYIHNRAAPTPLNTTNGRNFSNNSIVEIQDFGTTSAQPVYGNLIINNASTVQMSGKLSTVNGDLIKKNSGEFRLATNQTVGLAIGGNLDVQGGKFIIQSDSASNAATVSVRQSISITTGAILQRGSSGTGLWTFEVAGNWSNAGTFTPDTSTVTFNGNASSSSLQIFAGNTTFNNLTINSRAIVDIGASVMTVNGTYSNTGQIRHTPSITLTNCATGTVTEKDATNNNTLSLSSCIGDATFTGAMIKTTVGGSFPNVTIGSSTAYDSCPASNNVIKRYWEITPNSLSRPITATVTFIFRDSERNGNTGSVNVYKCVGGSWQKVSENAINQTDNGGGFFQVVATNIPIGSSYALGGSAPTAVKLTNFHAITPDQTVFFGVGVALALTMFIGSGLYLRLGKWTRGGIKTIR